MQDHARRDGTPRGVLPAAWRGRPRRSFTIEGTRMSKSKQIRLHVDALPLLDDLPALLVERSYTPVSRSSTLRYVVTLAAWYVRAARAKGQTEPALLAGTRPQGLEHDNTDAVTA